MSPERPDPDLRCERVRLLLSRRADGAATPDQCAEIDAHLPSCAGCRAASCADRAVGDRLRERSLGAARPGFAVRVAAAAAAVAVADRAAALAQNRFLRRVAAAAAVVAAVAVGASITHDRAAAAGAGEAGGAGLASARDAARAAVLRPRLDLPAPERK